MKQIIGNEIHISQGDSYALQIDFEKDDAAYTMVSGDSVTISISSGYTTTLTNVGESYVIFSLPTDIEAGAYTWDIAFNYSTGEVERLMYPTLYHVMEVA